MSTPQPKQLKLVAETSAQRADGLLKQAQDAAYEHITEGTQAMLTLEAYANEIASGGATYPVGVKEVFRLQAERLRHEHNRIKQIMERLDV